jgi:hypothetical protein
LAVLRGDNPAREFNHRVGHFLASGKQVDSGDRLRGGILGARRAEARECQSQRQRAMSGPDRRVYARIDGTVPCNEDWVARTTRWPAKATGSCFKRD